MTGVAVDSIDADAVVFTRTRETFIDVDLTVQASVAGFALTGVAVMLVNTGAAVLTGTALALVFLRFTVFPNPAWLTLTGVAMLLLHTLSVNAGPVGAVVHPRQTQRAVGAGRTEALEPVHFVHTGSSAHAGVRRTLVYLYVTFDTCVSRSADTGELVDAVVTLAELTRIRGAVVFINLTVHSCGSLRAVALVGVDQVDAAAAVLAGVAVTLLHLDVADGAGVTRVTLAGESGDAVLTDAVMTRLRDTVVDVLLTENAGEAFCTFAVVAVGSVDAFSSV